jgi:hypothetical protein
MEKIQKKQIRQSEVAESLDLSIRQVKRIYADFKKNGAKGVLIKKVGQEPHNKIHENRRKEIGEIVTREIYVGFGPLLMTEKLEERHQISLSKETVRQIMIEYGAWEPYRKKAPVVHPLRQKRTRFGELVQIDGSHHAWFENRGDPCVLIDFIDDATGKIVAMSFFPGETTDGYFVVSRKHITKYGRPLAYYSDRDSIFRTTRKEGLFEPTEFTRAMTELDVAVLCANSAQAKGLVERGHQVFQDRLIKEMRLLNISTIDEANLYLEEFIEFYNEKFAKRAKSPHDAHRKLLLEHNLDLILAHKADRKISKNFTISYENTIYQLLIENPTWEMRRGKVTVVVSTEGEVNILFKEKPVKFRVIEKQEAYAQIAKAKEIEQKIINIQRFLKEKKVYIPDNNHPYKRGAEGKMKQSEPIMSDDEMLLKLQKQNREDNLEVFNDSK